MGKVVSSGAWVVTCLCLGLVGACSSSTTEPTTKGSQSLYGGTDVPDAAKLGIVWIQAVKQVGSVPDPVNDSICGSGTGVLLTNDKLLTAAHVVDRDAMPATCKPNWLHLTMPDPSVLGGAQKRFISCATSKFCGAVTHAGYTTNATNYDGRDVAIVRRFTPLVVNGQIAFHRRALTRKATSTFYQKKLACYGMGRGDFRTITVGGQRPDGILRRAQFAALPFPHPNQATVQPPPADFLSTFFSPDMFAISRGGGVVPTASFWKNQTSKELEIIAIPGDSGGPCIDHTTLPSGDIVGIDHSGGSEKFGADPAPTFANFTAASGMRNFVRAALGVQAGSIALDLDGDGQADDGVEVRVSAFNTIEIVVTYNSGAQTFPFDTLVPTSAATLLQPLFAGTFGGDFDDDGDSDIVASIGTALSNLPFYFNGALPTSFSFTNLPQWQPGLGGYQHYVVGRYNSDAIDDVAAVRFDGSEDVFLGEKNVGLTVPAQFVPRGFSWWPKDNPDNPQESFAIAAPGPAAFASHNPSAPLHPEGFVYLFLSYDGDSKKLLPSELSLSKLKDNFTPKTLKYASAPDDRFGDALAWGSFDGDPNADTLVIAAPGVSVAGQARAGMVTTMYYGKAWPQLFYVEQLDRPSLGQTPKADDLFGSALAAGDFNGDGNDDLAIVSQDGLTVLDGVKNVGLTPSNAKKFFTESQLSATSGLASAESGDFNCDGFEDLALGIPNEGVAGAPAGQVRVLYGSPSGLDPKLSAAFDENVPGLATTPESGDFFGETLAAGNFNGDSQNGRPCVDLAIGVPGEGAAPQGKGAVHILFGSGDGLSASGSQHLMQGGPAAGNTTISDQSEVADVFGGSLAITRADLDRYDDLFIGAWHENNGQGAAHALRGSPSGITASGQAFWQQGSPSPIPGTPSTPGTGPFSPGDRFGWSLGGTSNGIALIGAPLENIPSPIAGAADIEAAGWAAILRLSDVTSNISLSAGTEFTEGGSALTTGLRTDARLGSVVTRARPAFVPVKTPPPRYSGTLLFGAPGGSGGDLNPPILSCSTDTEPPVFESVTLTPACIWPPNHKLVSYQLGENLQVQVSDNCSPEPRVRILSVTNNETGTSDSFFGPEALCLRAERNKKSKAKAKGKAKTSKDRTYTITLKATDNSGNSTETSVTVTVPQSKTPDCSTASASFLSDGDPACRF